MISLSKIVDNEKINTKLDLEALREKLPPVEQDICITLVATKHPSKTDNWEKNGTEYYNIILDYNKVLYSTSKYVLRLMLNESLAIIKK